MKRFNRVLYIFFKLFKDPSLAGVRVFYNYVYLEFLLLVSGLFKRKENIIKLLGFKVNFENLGNLVFLFEEIFVHQQYRFLSSKESPVIIDGGANIGMTVIYFKWLYPDSKIIAFEPHYYTFQLLQKNIELNNLQNVRLINKALNSFDGEASFYYDESNLSSPGMSLNDKTDCTKKMKVNCTLLSSYINEQIDYLKLDIEGSELACLSDLSATKAIDKINKLALECHKDYLEKGGLPSLLSLLEDNKFKYNFHAPFSNFEKFAQKQEFLLYAKNSEYSD